MVPFTFGGGVLVHGGQEFEKVGDRGRGVQPGTETGEVGGAAGAGEKGGKWEERKNAAMWTKEGEGNQAAAPREIMLGGKVGGFWKNHATTVKVAVNLSTARAEGHEAGWDPEEETDRDQHEEGGTGRPRQGGHCKSERAEMRQGHGLSPGWGGRLTSTSGWS